MSAGPCRSYASYVNENQPKNAPLDHRTEKMLEALRTAKRRADSFVIATWLLILAVGVAVGQWVPIVAWIVVVVALVAVATGFAMRGLLALISEVRAERNFRVVDRQQ